MSTVVVDHAVHSLCTRPERVEPSGCECGWQPPTRHNLFPVAERTLAPSSANPSQKNLSPVNSVR